MNHETSPILSICIPTYNSAQLLKVMLETLVPQVAAADGRVEVWVSDNASDDDTAEVVDAARRYGAINYWRHQTNTGALNNVISSASRLARGEYVWVLGSHNLVLPGALARVLGILENHRHLDLFYTNFRCARYPEHWPESAVGGFPGDSGYLANEELDDREIGHWHELVNDNSALCTQVYAHIVRRNIWRDFWGDTYFKEIFVDAATTYPHSHMIAATSFHKPSYYIGEPTITIFNGAQTWGTAVTRCSVLLIGLPDLIKQFARNGLSVSQSLSAKEFNKSELYRVAVDFFTGHVEKKYRLSALFILQSFRNPYLIRPLLQGFVDSDSCLPARLITGIGQKLGAFYQYAVYRCRPARWFWSKYRS